MAYSYGANKLYSPFQLGEWCLRALGKGAHKIEVTEDQLMDRIFEAMDAFVTFHYDGSRELFQPYVVTQADVDRGYIKLGEDVAAVIDILHFKPYNLSSFEEFERINFLLAQTDFVNRLDSVGGLLDFHITMSTIEMYGDYFTPDPQFRFNEITKELNIQGKLVAGSTFLLHHYKITDPDEFEGVYNNEFLKRYATVLVGLQWGRNIRKYDGVQLAGGVTLSGERIYEDYKEQFREIKEELRLKYEEPAHMFMA